jgi:hypothetical protein
MKKLTGYLTILLIMAGSLMLCSCHDQSDHYSVGDFMVSFGVVEQIPESQGNYIIQLDNGDKFIPVANSPFQNELKNNQRVLVNFAPFDDKVNPDKSKTLYGKINLVKEILYKNIQTLTVANNDSLGHDPIIVRDIWVTGDSILSVHFNYYTHGSLHLVNLANNSEGNGKDKPFIFEFRHNAMRDEESYLVAGDISFKLNPFKIKGENKMLFYLRYTDYDGRRIDLPQQINY